MIENLFQKKDKDALQFEKAEHVLGDFFTVSEIQGKYVSVDSLELGKMNLRRSLSISNRPEMQQEGERLEKLLQSIQPGAPYDYSLIAQINESFNKISDILHT